MSEVSIDDRTVDVALSNGSSPRRRAVSLRGKAPTAKEMWTCVFGDNIPDELESQGSSDHTVHLLVVYGVHNTIFQIGTTLGLSSLSLSQGSTPPLCIREPSPNAAWKPLKGDKIRSLKCVSGPTSHSINPSDAISHLCSIVEYFSTSANQHKKSKNVGSSEHTAQSEMANEDSQAWAYFTALLADAISLSAECANDRRVACSLKAEIFARTGLFRESFRACTLFAAMKDQAEGERKLDAETDESDLEAKVHNLRIKALYAMGAYASCVEACEGRSLALSSNSKLDKIERAARAQSASDDAARERLDVEAIYDQLGGFPSISHMPFSPQIASDDTILPAGVAGLFTREEVTISEKMDGGNCCLCNGRVYARTHKHEASHESFSLVKDLYLSFSHLMTAQEFNECALFGENMGAVHSIKYNALKSPFYLFSVFQMKEKRWYSWEEVTLFAARLRIPTAPLLFKGHFASMADLRAFLAHHAAQTSVGSHGEERDGIAPATPEGFVVRLSRSFTQEEFSHSIGKYVRKGHLQTKLAWKRTWEKSVFFSEYDVERDLEEGNFLDASSFYVAASEG